MRCFIFNEILRVVIYTVKINGNRELIAMEFQFVAYIYARARTYIMTDCLHAKTTPRLNFNSPPLPVQKLTRLYKLNVCAGGKIYSSYYTT